MINVASSLVSRGLEAYASAGQTDGNGDQIVIPIPTWARLTLSATFIVFLGAMFMIEYTFGRVIPTLLMIESPADDTAFEPLATQDADIEIRDPEQPLRPKFVTASFRTSVRHLRSVGGFAACFRGFALFLVNSFFTQMIAGIVSLALPRSLANIVTVVALSQLALEWTHIVISEPSPKPWYKRIPGPKTWRKVAGPTALLAICEQLAVFIPVHIAIAIGMTDNPTNLTPHERNMLGFKGLALVLLGFVLAFFLVIPANVILTRVQASLLPDSDETIVPFDRTFGGKFVPEIIGGSGVGLLDAWRTFDWASRIRLVKAYAKLFAMEFTLWILLTAFVSIQLFLVVGTDFSKLIPGDGNKSGEI